METAARTLFERYARLFNQAIGGNVDMEEVAALYASDFIAASPAGVMCGKNDEAFRQAMVQAYARYRAIGTREMRIRNLRVSPIDEHHSMAHVGWTAIYSRSEAPDVTIDFEVHYLVQQRDTETKVFGWVASDEEALLKKHGIV